MRSVVVVCFFALSACGFSVHSGTSVNAGIGSAPVRRVVVPFSYGFYFAAKKYGTVEAQFPMTLGALGGKSEPIFGFGGRFFTHSKGWRPGYYGALAVGVAAFVLPKEEGEEPPPAPDARMYRFGGGVVWTAIKPDSYGYPWHDAVATVGLGLVYHHQRQEGIGTGDFLGIELNVSVGFSGLAALDAFTKEDDD